MVENVVMVFPKCDGINAGFVRREKRLMGAGERAILGLPERADEL